jgi:hypothetical protein
LLTLVLKRSLALIAALIAVFLLGLAVGGAVQAGRWERERSAAAEAVRIDAERVNAELAELRGSRDELAKLNEDARAILRGSGELVEKNSATAAEMRSQILAIKAKLRGLQSLFDSAP